MGVWIFILKNLIKNNVIFALHLICNYTPTPQLLNVFAMKIFIKTMIINQL